MSVLNKIYFRGLIFANNIKRKLEEERGAVDLVAIIIIIGIVAVVAGIFGKTLKTFVEETLKKWLNPDKNYTD